MGEVTHTDKGNGVQMSFYIICISSLQYHTNPIDTELLTVQQLSSPKGALLPCSLTRATVSETIYR